MKSATPKTEITILKIGFMASCWSDVKTYGILFGMFFLNNHFIDSNNFVDAILFMIFISYLFLASSKCKYINKFKKVEDAIKFLEETT